MNKDKIDIEEEEEEVEKKIEYKDVYEEISVLIARFDYDKAIKICQKEILKDNENTKILDLTGYAFLQMGDFKNAKKAFQKSISILPKEGYFKYMYLAQISESFESVKYFKKGIEILLNMKKVTFNK
jgi:tetratricopeptide (TPR) repeat protein